MPSRDSRAEGDALLLELARRSVAHGLRAGCPLGVDPAALPAELGAPGASFVTLRRGGELRGCIGSLEAHRPLAQDVSHNAWQAAFGDPRFDPLAAHELEGLHVEISILAPSQPLLARSEPELLAALRPGVDGLVLRLGARRATFLPSVWSSLPDAREFVAALKRKAGLREDYWSQELAFERYLVREIA
jgi:AmmeMemoRadiSam system protein A